MTYVLSEEYGELAAAVRQLLQRNPTSARVRALADDGGTPFDRGVWDRMATELGITGLLVPEHDGGSGGSLLAATAVLEESGAQLDAAPTLPALIVTALLTGVAGMEDVRDAIVDGSAIPAVAWCPDLDLAGEGPVPLGGVLFGRDAELILVLTDRAIAIVDATGADVQRDGARSIDLTRSGARVVADRSAIRLAALSDAAADLAAATLALLVAAELVGVLRGALAQLRDYAAVRTAFGRIVGSFQGVKHQLADLAIALEVGQTLVRSGAAALERGDTAPALAAAWWISDRVLSATAATVRLHGGIGYTWEYDAQLWYRRARADQALLGPRGRLAARLDRAIGIAAP